MSLITTAIILGIVEGLTEFLPVSSTGHLILATRLLGYDEKPWEVFNVVIQLPAIMAVVVVFWRRFLDVALGLLKREKPAISFVINVLVAFIPAAILGGFVQKANRWPDGKPNGGGLGAVGRWFCYSGGGAFRQTRILS